MYVGSAVAITNQLSTWVVWNKAFWATTYIPWASEALYVANILVHCIPYSQGHRKQIQSDLAISIILWWYNNVESATVQVATGGPGWMWEEDVRVEAMAILNPKMIKNLSGHGLTRLPPMAMHIQPMQGCINNQKEDIIRLCTLHSAYQNMPFPHIL